MPRRKKTTMKKPLAAQPPAKHLAADDLQHDEEPTTPACYPCFNNCLPRLPNCIKPNALIETAGRWRAEHPDVTSHLARRLEARLALDALVNAHLSRLRSRYLLPPAASLPRDLPPLLLPSWASPLASASSYYLSDFLRPSALLLSAAPRLVPGLRLRASVFSSAARRLRAHEAALDQEMAEYQSTAVLTLPFGLCRRPADDASESMAAVMAKMASVVARAQRLRWRAIEVLAADVESDQAAEFFVGLAGVQEMVHRRASWWAHRTGPVFVPVRAFGLN